MTTGLHYIRKSNKLISLKVRHWGNHTLTCWWCLPRVIGWSCASPQEKITQHQSIIHNPWHLPDSMVKCSKGWKLYRYSLCLYCDFRSPADYISHCHSLSRKCFVSSEPPKTERLTPSWVIQPSGVAHQTNTKGCVFHNMYMDYLSNEIWKRNILGIRDGQVGGWNSGRQNRVKPSESKKGKNAWITATELAGERHNNRKMEGNTTFPNDTPFWDPIYPKTPTEMPFLFPFSLGKCIKAMLL